MKLAFHFIDGYTWLNHLTLLLLSKKNLASVAMKVDWNLPIPQNMKSLLTRSSNKQLLIDLFVQKLVIDGIHFKQATGG